MKGADGFMSLDFYDAADIRLHFYNHDGSRAEMCGNGARCICRFAYDNGIVGEKMTVETDAGIVEGERISERVYRVRLNDPTDIDLNKKEGVAYAVVGVPHAVTELDSLEWSRSGELLERARELRYDKCFDRGANVNFYSMLDNDTVRILTYERGVEDFTLACGTGSGAVATILWSRGVLSGGALTVKNRGGDLELTVCSDENKITALYLEGGADVGEIFEY